jgi:hypothetical protein
LGKDLVNGAEQVSPERLEASWPTLSQLDEVVNKHVRVAQRIRVHLIGWGTHCGLFRFRRHLRVESLESLSSGGVFFSPGQRVWGEVVQSRSGLF